MKDKQAGDGYLDWTILKYGWLVVFMIHGVFLVGGLHFLRRAYLMENPALYSPEQLRVSYLLTSVYWISIAFSLILIILAVFVLEIFRGMQQVTTDLQAVKEALELPPPPDLGALDATSPDESGLDDTIPWAGDAPGLRSEKGAPDGV